MATGTVTYAAPVAGVRFKPIEVPSSHPAVEKVIVETEDSERIQVVFHLLDVFTETEANAIAGDIVASITNRLAFELNRGVGQPYMKGFSLPKDASGSSYTVLNSAGILWDVAAPTITLGDESRQKLARLLEQPLARPDLYSAYRFAINQSDDVTRFMFLYNILLQLNHDMQPRVETFIRAVMPDVEEYDDPRPNKTGKETVFTRLRNEVGHARKGTTPEQTRTLIEGYVAALQTLVKTAISHAT
jgi:hypothetical protein